jgi:UDP-3-O-[3-hydroxymyristoyl] glucosamine N-acyltransferase
MKENKKYEILEDDFILHEGKKLYRIRAIEDVRDGDELVACGGDKGGYVESYHNLSQEEGCWIFDSAKVYENARIEDNAFVCKEVEVFGNAVIRGSAAVDGNSKIYGNARISYHSYVCDSEVFGNAVIKGTAGIKDFCKIYDNSTILRGGIYIENHICIHGNAIIGDSEFGGNDRIELNCNVDISGNSTIRGRTVDAYKSNISGNVDISGESYLNSFNISGNSKIVNKILP